MEDERQRKKAYEEKYDAFDRTYSVDEHPNAKQKRDGMARELRREGWTVQTETSGGRYGLSAERRKKSEDAVDEEI